MAKKQLTIEEKLEAALVPAEEQPYKVPENWCWVRLDKLYQVNPKNEDVDEDTRAAFISMANIDGGLTSNFTYEIQSWKQAKKGHTQMADGDVAFAKISPCFENRKSMIVEGLENGIGGGTTELIILRQPNVNKEYTFWLVSTEEFISKGCTTYSGTVGQQRISMDFVKNYPVPLAPLNEQSRIVARIESLFAKLDEAKEKIQEVLDGADLRRAAILHQAFTGKLTEKWRRENEKKLSDWQIVALKDCFDITGGIQKKPSRKADKNPIPYITVANVYRDRIDISDLRYFEVFEGELEKYQLVYGDILIVEGNGSGKEIGRCAIWRDELPVCIHQNHIIRARKKDDSIIPEYVLYYLNSSMGIRVMQERARTTSGLYSLSTGKIKTITIPKATVSEQQEIVRLLDNLLSREQATVNACKKALNTIDTLKKSILARAFRGDLGTGDPSEASAKELLQEILAS